MSYKGGFPPIIYYSENDNVETSVSKKRLLPPTYNIIDISTIIKTNSKPIIDITQSNDVIDII